MLKSILIITAAVILHGCATPADLFHPVISGRDGRSKPYHPYTGGKVEQCRAEVNTWSKPIFDENRAARIASALGNVLAIAGGVAVMATTGNTLGIGVGAPSLKGPQERRWDRSEEAEAMCKCLSQWFVVDNCLEPVPPEKPETPAAKVDG